MKNTMSNRGFTLVELMVGVLIMGILMIIVMNFVFAQMNSYQREQKVSDTQQNLRIVMDQMERDIRMAGAGIPKIPISTGWTSLPNSVIYPLYIIQGATLATTGTNRIFNITTSTGVNDSIIIIYQDPEMPDADGVLMQDMINPTDPIVVQPSMINGGSVKRGFPSNGGNTPFIIVDTIASTADLFMATSITGNTLNVSAANGASPYNTSHPNFPTAATAANGIGGYASGSRVFAVKVVRYDWDPAVNNFPITRTVNADYIRGTDNAIGEFFGASISAAATNNALDIVYLPYTGATATTAFLQGMPANPYNIGIVRITLTARTSVPFSSFSNNSMLRTRTMTTDIQLRNYN
jgi:prepilin-type N-terminal cleavage/methylation domain-containing protein